MPQFSFIESKRTFICLSLALLETSNPEAGVFVQFVHFLSAPVDVAKITSCHNIFDFKAGREDALHKISQYSKTLDS